MYLNPKKVSEQIRKSKKKGLEGVSVDQSDQMEPAMEAPMPVTHSSREPQRMAKGGMVRPMMQKAEGGMIDDEDYTVGNTPATPTHDIDSEDMVGSRGMHSKDKPDDDMINMGMVEQDEMGLTDEEKTRMKRLRGYFDSMDL